MLDKKKITITTLFSFILLLIIPLQSNSQGFDNGNNISLSLLKDSLNLSPGQFGFNALTITNFGGADMSFGGKVSVPDGWTLLKEFPNQITVRAGQSVSIPIRIRCSSAAYGGIKYPIQLEIFDPQSGITHESTFNSHISENTSWKAELKESTKFVTDAETLPDFSFKIENKGNRIEGFDISFRSGFNLTVPSEGFQLFLKPGKDTTITIGIRNRTLDQLSDQIKINIRARNMNKVLIQKIFIVTDLYIPRENIRYTLPINLQWSGSNLLFPDRYFQSFDIYSHFQLSQYSGISLRYRSLVAGLNFEEANSFINLNWNFQNGTLSLGNYQDLMLVLVDGIGAKFEYRTPKNQFSAFGLKGRIASDYTASLRVESKIKKENLLSNQVFYINNDDTKVSNIFSHHEFEHYRSQNSNFKLSAGYSFEKSSKFEHSETGYTAGGSLNLEKKIFSIRSNVNSFSTYFPGVNRGLTYQNHDFRLKLGKFFVGAYGNQVIRRPGTFNFSFSEITPRLAVKNEEYGIQFGIKGSKLNLVSRVTQVGQLQFDENNPKMTGSKATVNLVSTKAKFQQHYQVYALKSSFGNTDDITQNMTYGMFFSGRYRGFGYISKLDYGPNFYFDFLYFSKTGSVPFRNQHSVYFQNQKGKFLRNRSSLHYFSLSRNTGANFQLSNDTFVDIPKLGLSLNFSVSTNLMEIKRAPVLSLSLNKSLNIPIPFFKRFNTLKVALFKDSNNNNIKDAGEESVNDATIKVNEQYLKSNNQGELQLQNVKKGAYIIDYQSINNQYGWKTAKGIRDTVKLNKDKTVYIPFKKTNSISGSIEVERAPYSINKAPDLQGIKILATNLNGDVFKTLTDQNGDFFLNLNEDIYVIQIPTNLYNDEFKFKQSKFQINLFENNSPSIELNLVERSRKINIKRANSTNQP